MGKELEALERLKTAPSFMGGTYKYRFSTNSASALLEDYELVKQALQRLEAIEKGKNTDIIDNYMAFKSSEQVEPSEALKELEQDIKNRVILAEDRQLELCKIIKQALTTKSKKEQAFDIVKDCFSVGEYKKRHYHLINECSDCRESMGDISKEEFDLLKEVLE